MSSNSDHADKMSGKESASDRIDVLRHDVGATSAEYEDQQSYLKGARLRLVTASYVFSRFIQKDIKLHQPTHYIQNLHGPILIES